MDTDIIDPDLEGEVLEDALPYPGGEGGTDTQDKTPPAAAPPGIDAKALGDTIAAALAGANQAQLATIQGLVAQYAPHFLPKEPGAPKLTPTEIAAENLALQEALLDSTGSKRAKDVLKSLLADATPRVAEPQGPTQEQVRRDEERGEDIAERYKEKIFKEVPAKIRPALEKEYDSIMTQEAHEWLGRVPKAQRDKGLEEVKERVFGRKYLKALENMQARSQEPGTAVSGGKGAQATFASLPRSVQAREQAQARARASNWFDEKSQPKEFAAKYKEYLDDQMRLRREEA